MVHGDFIAIPGLAITITNKYRAGAVNFHNCHHQPYRAAGHCPLILPHLVSPDTVEPPISFPFYPALSILQTTSISPHRSIVFLAPLPRNTTYKTGPRIPSSLPFSFSPRSLSSFMAFKEEISILFGSGRTLIGHGRRAHGTTTWEGLPPPLSPET